MRIYLSDQSNKFEKLLTDLIKKPVMLYDKRKLNEKVTTIEIKSNERLGQVDLGFLFEYEIFPSNIMTYMTQWRSEKRKMQIGDTILQQTLIPPTKYFSQKIIFAVRINKIIDDMDRKGFSYENWDDLF